MVGLGGAIRFCYLPNLTAIEAHTAALRRFRRIITLEAGVAVPAILATAALAQTPPHSLQQRAIGQPGWDTNYRDIPHGSTQSGESVPYC